MEAGEIQTSEAVAHIGKSAKLKGHVHAVRKLGNVAFVIIRDRAGMLQLVAEDPSLLSQIAGLACESPVIVEGLLSSRPSSSAGVEMQLKKLHVLATPAAALPVEINKDTRMKSLSLGAMLDYRPLTLRSPLARSIFKIEAAFCAAFRQFLNGEGFTEIHSPKLVSTGTEGGAQLFKLDYFGQPAYLAQSPQFYKQIMVGVFERVFEIGPVYRAEDHDTSRHVNEYVSMDLEMGFISSEQDLIAMQIRLLHHMFERVRETCAAELELHEATVPAIGEIPQVTIEEAINLLTSHYRWRPEPGSLDLDPEAERLLCEHFLKKEGTDLVYVTGYPRDVRPFYAMPIEGTEATHSFDLLFRGLEITTGGQRIHRHQQLVESISGRGLEPDSFSDYLQCFSYGMPPHGGLAIGLERLAKQLLGLPNVKLAALFPRDRNRLTP